jgi:hypothetical protein
MPGINNGYAIRLLRITVKGKRKQNEQNNNRYVCHFFKKLKIQGIQFFNTIKFHYSMNQLLTTGYKKFRAKIKGTFNKSFAKKEPGTIN